MCWAVPGGSIPVLTSEGLQVQLGLANVGRFGRGGPGTCCVVYGTRERVRGAGRHIGSIALQCALGWCGFTESSSAQLAKHAIKAVHPPEPRGGTRGFLVNSSGGQKCLLDQRLTCTLLCMSCRPWRRPHPALLPQEWASVRKQQTQLANECAEAQILLKASILHAGKIVRLYWALRHWPNQRY